MNVGDKVIVDGKETEITAIAYDDLGIKVYMVKGSMKDHYEEELKMIHLEEITLKDYELTNIGLDGYYRVRLKDGGEYKIYSNKENGKIVDYIKKDGKMVRINKEVQKIVLAKIREYERDGI